MPVVELFSTEGGIPVWAMTWFQKPQRDKPYSTRIMVKGKDEDGNWKGQDLCTGLHVTCRSEIPLQGDLTCYDAKVCSLQPLEIQLDPTKVFVHQEHAPWHFGEGLVDLCSGTGAMSHAVEALGGKTIVLVDNNGLACEHLRRNHGDKVIQGSIGDTRVLQKIHQKLSEEKVTGFTLLAGFPCQPFSRQGAGREEADHRFQTFPELILATVLLGPQAAIFECVPGAKRNAKVQQGIHALQSALAWEKCEIVSELSQHWPMRRHRWFCVLTHPEWIQHMQVLGNEETNQMTVGDVIGRFYRDDEIDCEQLLLSSFEIECYQDQRLGSDVRVLTTQAVCATTLHSYGSALTKCPCLCRSAGLSFTSLIEKGLRGFYVACEKGHGFRYLHHQELASLLGISTDMSFGSDQKQNLCLLGLVASPIQVILVFGNLLHAAAYTAHNLQSIHPRVLLEHYKNKLIKQHRATLHHTADKAHYKIISLHDDSGPAVFFGANGPNPIQQLEQAERIQQEWGASLHTGIIANYSTEEHSTDEDMLYIQIDRPLKKSRTEQPAGKVALIIKHSRQSSVVIGNKGDFLFQFLQQSGATNRQITDALGRPVPADTRIWTPSTYQALDVTSFPQLPSTEAQLRANGLTGVPRFATLGDQGLTDKAIDDIALTLVQAAGQSNTQYWPPRLALHIIEAWTSLAHQHIQDNWPQDQPLFGVLWDEGHWISYKASIQQETLIVTLFDGLGRPPVDYVEYLFFRVANALKCTSIQLEVRTHITQTFGRHCGTIALLHLQHALGLPTTMTETHAYNWHRQIADEHIHRDIDSPSTTLSLLLTGEGADSLATLAKLLQDKGVPAKAARTRADNVLQKLGPQTIDKVLQDKNPWASLKQAANKPGIMLKLLTDAERTAYIEDRAQTKHGAEIKHYKNKKQYTKQTAHEALTLQPDQLEINAKHFQDPEGKPVPQISFDQVGAEQHGVAICTAEMAAPFIHQAKSISTAALGLLLVDLPPQEHIDKAGITRLRYPAKYISTQEHILIFGGLLDIGDKPITRVLQGPVSKLDTIQTNVIRVQVYREQLQMPREDFAQSPVKQLVLLMPQLTLCKGEECGTACPRFHAPLDTPLETVITEVWGRVFALTSGGKKEAHNAEMFAVNLRVVEPALQQIVTNNPVGIYTDPKAADGKSPHEDYTVIWLTKASYQEASHQARLCTFTLSLVTARQRYGVRVLKTAEAKAWTQLKPEVDYTPVRVSSIFEIAPLPHGTQRKAIQQMLSNWSWPARPLQPGKGTFEHMSWRIGSDQEPPAFTLQAFGQDVLIYKVKQYEATARHADVSQDANPHQESNARHSNRINRSLDQRRGAMVQIQRQHSKHSTRSNSPPPRRNYRTHQERPAYTAEQGTPATRRHQHDRHAAGRENPEAWSTTWRDKRKNQSTAYMAHGSWQANPEQSAGHAADEDWDADGNAEANGTARSRTQDSSHRSQKWNLGRSQANIQWKLEHHERKIRSPTWEAPEAWRWLTRAHRGQNRVILPAETAK